MRDRARTNGKKDNREKKPATSHKGVYWNKACQVLFSQIKINNIGYYLGDYGSEKHAALAYQLALNDYEKYGILPRSRGLRGRVLAAFRPRKRL